MDGIVLAGVVIAAWIVAVLYLESIGFWAKRNVTAVGPLLMWKTVRGRELIDRVARWRRLWRAYGDVSIGLVALSMVGITGLLLWEATLVPSIPPERVPSPQTLLGIPGINPVIPVGYGIAGLAVAIVLHEFLHGILARVSKTTIRSLGVLLFVVPIGAFVEPDEDQLKALPRRERARLFSVGPATNLVLAAVFAYLFSSVLMSAVQPVAPGVGITGYSLANSPAQSAVCISNCTGVSGGLAPRMVIVAVNSTMTPTLADFRGAMGLVRPGRAVDVQAWDGGVVRTFRVTPAADAGGGAVLGIFGFETSTDYYHPLGSAARFGGLDRSALVYVALPFQLGQGRAPIQEPATDFYAITGPWSALPPWAFWFLANIAYWMFWLNLMLGATNALPAIPLDGGYVFRDGLAWLFERSSRAVRVGAATTLLGIGGLSAAFWAPGVLVLAGLVLLAAGVAILVAAREGDGARKPETWVNRLSYAFALLILGLIVWQFLGPFALNLSF